MSVPAAAFCVARLLSPWIFWLAICAKFPKFWPEKSSVFRFELTPKLKWDFVDEVSMLVWAGAGAEETMVVKSEIEAMREFIVINLKIKEKSKMSNGFIHTLKKLKLAFSDLFWFSIGRLLTQQIPLNKYNHAMRYKTTLTKKKRATFPVPTKPIDFWSGFGSKLITHLKLNHAFTLLALVVGHEKRFLWYLVENATHDVVCCCCFVQRILLSLDYKEKLSNWFLVVQHFLCFQKWAESMSSTFAF